MSPERLQVASSDKTRRLMSADPRLLPDHHHLLPHAFPSFLNSFLILLVHCVFSVLLVLFLHAVSQQAIDQFANVIFLSSSARASL